MPLNQIAFDFDNLPEDKEPVKKAVVKKDDKPSVKTAMKTEDVQYN